MIRKSSRKAIGWGYTREREERDRQGGGLRKEDEAVRHLDIGNQSQRNTFKGRDKETNCQD